MEKDPVKSALFASKVAKQVDFATLDSVFVLPLRRPRHGVARQPHLVGGPGVAGDLVQASMARDGGNLVGRASGLREPTTGRLAQPVRLAARRQSGGVAPVAELLAEGVAAIRLARRGDQEGQMLAGGGVEHRLQ